MKFIISLITLLMILVFVVIIFNLAAPGMFPATKAAIYIVIGYIAAIIMMDEEKD